MTTLALILLVISLGQVHAQADLIRQYRAHGPYHMVRGAMAWKWAWIALAAVNFVMILLEINGLGPDMVQALARKLSSD